MTKVRVPMLARSSPSAAPASTAQSATKTLRTYGGCGGVLGCTGWFPLPVFTAGSLCYLSPHSHRCICNIDCSGHNENPVCATDGNSYNNPCLVREASCMKQEQIDVKHLGRCPGEKHLSHTRARICSYCLLIHGDSSFTVLPVYGCPSQLTKTKVGRKTTVVLLKSSVRSCFIQIFHVLIQIFTFHHQTPNSKYNDKSVGALRILRL